MFLIRFNTSYVRFSPRLSVREKFNFPNINRRTRRRRRARATTGNKDVLILVDARVFQNNFFLVVAIVKNNDVFKTIYVHACIVHTNARALQRALIASFICVLENHLTAVKRAHESFNNVWPPPR